MRYDRLHEAANRSDIKAMASALADGLSPNAFDCDGHLPLHFAVRSGSMDAVALLLKSGADPRLQTSYGESPLAMAARARHRQLVLTMASNGGFKDCDEKEMACIMPPLHVAVCLGKVADAKELVKQCADVDVNLLVEAAGYSHVPAKNTMRAFLAGMPPTQWRGMLNGPLCAMYKRTLYIDFEAARVIAEYMAPSSDGAIELPDADTIITRWPCGWGCEIQTTERVGLNGTRSEWGASTGRQIQLLCGFIFFVTSFSVAFVWLIADVKQQHEGRR